MKRFYEVRIGKELRKDYDPVARRGNVETDFSFVENKIPTKANLTYDSFPCGKENGKGKVNQSSMSKKVRMNDGKQVFSVGNKENVKNGMNADMMQKLEELDKAKRDRDNANDRLKYIGDMLNSQQRNDSWIVDNLRNYFGSFAKRSEPYSNDLEERDNGREAIEDELLTDEPEDAKEVVMLIEGESM